MDGYDDIHDEEVRFAVVLNGGVSLAIWMGGVAREIDRLTRTKPGDDDVYGRVLALLKAQARVDVIAGTSAGGINGAFLALGQAYENADLSCLRDLWGTSGGFSALLRSPWRGPLPSLLKGDDYFLPELRKGFERVVRTPGSNLTDVNQRPVDLWLTTTVPVGQRRPFQDVLDQPLWEVEHTGRFHFCRGPRPLEQSQTVDQFDDPDIRQRLALAARSTASFPAAFEPSFVPVGPDDADELHPDMRGRVSFEHSRYVIDGGVLMNKPMRPALQAMWQKRASTQVRRFLLYVNPDPGPKPGNEAEPRTPLPPLRDVLLASVTRLTLQQSIYEDLKEFHEANRRAQDLRLARPHLLEQLGSPKAIHDAARGFFPVYQDVRAHRAAIRIADLARERLEETPTSDSERLRQLLVLTLGERRPGGAEPAAVSGDRGLPYVPYDLDAQQALNDWSWGIAPLERLVAFTLDLLKRAIWLLPERHGLCAELKAARAAVYDQRAKIEKLRSDDTHFWLEQLEKLRPLRKPTIDQLEAWVDSSLADYRSQFLDDARRRHAAIAERLVEQLPVVAKVAAKAPDDLAPVSARTREHDLLGTTVTALGIPADRERVDMPTLLSNLLAFEVCQLAATGDSDPQQEQDAQLVLVSAHTENWFATSSTKASDKVTGLKLNHFGAFYKESWRINDWIWGRVDAVTQLMQAMLEVDRLRQLGVTPDDIRASLGEQALPAELRAGIDRELATYEREGQDNDEARTLVRLSQTAKGFAYQEQQRIVADELQRLAEAVTADELDGASRRSSGSRFRMRYDKLEAPERRKQALRLFDEARIGAEPFLEEFGTDLFSRTTATAAAGAVGAVDDQGSGLGRLRAITRPVRGLTLLLYALVANMTRGPFGAALVNLALAAGGALVAVSLMGDEPAWVTNLGAALVLAGLLAAALRTRLWNLALLAGPPLLFLSLLLIVQREIDSRLGLIITVLAIVLGGWLLSFAREPSLPPSRRHLSEPFWRLWRPAALLAILAGLVLVLVWVRADRTDAGWRQALTFLLAAPDQATSEASRDALVARWPGLDDWDVVAIAGLGVLALLIVVAFAASHVAAGAEPSSARVVTARWMPWYGLAFGAVAAVTYGAALVNGKLATWQPALAITALVCWLAATLVAPVLLLRKPKAAAPGRDRADLAA